MGGSCQGTDAAGCSFTYTARNHGNVWVHVDGQKMDARFGSSSLPYTLAGGRRSQRGTAIRAPPIVLTAPPAPTPAFRPYLSASLSPPPRSGRGRWGCGRSAL